MNQMTMTALVLKALRHEFRRLNRVRNQIFSRAAEATEEDMAVQPPKPTNDPLLNYPGKRLPLDMWTREEQESVLLAAEDDDSFDWIPQPITPPDE